MDKISEKVLKYCVRQSSNDLYTPISVSADDFKLSYSQLNSVGDNLVKQGYLTDFEFASEETKTGKAYLSITGISYFGMKNSDSLNGFNKTVLIPIIVTLLTELSLFLLKPLWPLIQELLFHTP